MASDHLEFDAEVVAAARAVIERWDSPAWKDTVHTAVYINRLRNVLDLRAAATDNNSQEKPVVIPAAGEQRVPTPAMAANSLTDPQIDALDTFALHVMAPCGRQSVRDFAHAVLHAQSAGAAPERVRAARPGIKTVFGLDYDGTITRDPDLWFALMKTMQAHGHEVHIVTMRHEVEATIHREPMEERFLKGADGVHFTGNPVSFDRDAKLPVMKSKGIPVDVWIEDNPKAVHLSAIQIWGWCTKPGDPMLHSSPEVDGAELALAVPPAGGPERHASREMLDALRATQEACEVSKCPWCGVWGASYSESDQPVDRCHHEYGLVHWSSFTQAPESAAMATTTPEGGLETTADLRTAADVLLRAMRHVEGAAMDYTCERRSIRDGARSAIETYLAAKTAYEASPAALPVGVVEDLDTDSEGATSAWVALNNPVEVGTHVYVHPSPARAVHDGQIKALAKSLTQRYGYPAYDTDGNGNIINQRHEWGLNPLIKQAIDTLTELSTVQPVPVIGVDKMVDSVNGVSWWPYILVGKRKHHTNKHGADFQNRAEWEAALLRWVLLGADKPEIRDIMDAPKSATPEPTAASQAVSADVSADGKPVGIKIRCSNRYWARKVQILLAKKLGARWGDDPKLAIPWSTFRLRLLVQKGVTGDWFLSWVPEREFDAVALPEWDAKALIAAAPQEAE